MRKISRTHRLPISQSGSDLGGCLRTERLARGYSLGDLARAVGVTKGYLSRLETGKARPSTAMIERLAKALIMDASLFHVLAGYLPTDIKAILYHHPVEAPAILREAFGEYGPHARRAQPTPTGLRPAAGALTFTEMPPNWQGLYELVHADCFEWLEQRAPNSVHAVVTDPPYGLREYTPEEKSKLRRGRGGVWRIPPAFDGCTRSPVPRFTVLTEDDKASLTDFFSRWATRVFRVLVPGGHVFIATNPLVSQFVYLALIQAGFEKRGEIIRLVQTLRGGDRPKNAHKEFAAVTVMPRSCWEPWGVFRKPCEGRVQDNLRKWKTGGLRRVCEEHPFCDVIRSSPTRAIEREIAPHPSLKPQGFMRQIVRAALPLGEGIVLDPFMGGGSTIAAACAVGYRSIGIESDLDFYKIAVRAITHLASLVPNGDSDGTSVRAPSKVAQQQQALF